MTRRVPFGLQRRRRPDRAIRRSACAAARSSAARQGSAAPPRRSSDAAASSPTPAAIAATSSAVRPACSPAIGTASVSCASPLKWRRKPAVSLVASVPQISDQRARRLILEIGHRLGEHAAAVFVMAAVEPDFGARRREIDQRAAAQPLQPRRPFGLARGRAPARARSTSARSRATRRAQSRRCHADGGRADAAAACREGRSSSSKTRRPFSSCMKKSRPPTMRGAPTRSASRSMTSSARSSCSAMIAGAPRFRMPAFS